MKRVFASVFVVVFLCVVVAFLLSRRSTKQIVTPSKPKVSPNVALEKSVETVKENIPEGGIALTLTEKNTGAVEKTITVALKAKEYTVFDAVDFRMDFTNIDAACSKGDAVPLYPRILADNTSLVLTGVAKVDVAHIYFGSTNSTLATCTIRKTDPHKRAAVSFNKGETHIYSVGKDITDYTHSFTDLQW